MVSFLTQVDCKIYQHQVTIYSQILTQLKCICLCVQHLSHSNDDSLFFGGGSRHFTNDDSLKLFKELLFLYCLTEPMTPLCLHRINLTSFMFNSENCIFCCISVLVSRPDALPNLPSANCIVQCCKMCPCLLKTCWFAKEIVPGIWVRVDALVEAEWTRKELLGLGGRAGGWGWVRNLQG